MQIADAEFNVPSTTTVSFGGRAVTIGLTWEPVSLRDSRSTKRDLKGFQATAGYDLAVVHAMSGLGGQGGLGAAVAVAPGGAIRLDTSGTEAFVLAALNKEVGEYAAFGHSYGFHYLSPGVDPSLSGGLGATDMELEAVLAGPADATYRKAHLLSTIGAKGGVSLDRGNVLPFAILGGLVLAIGGLVSWKLHSDAEAEAAANAPPVQAAAPKKPVLLAPTQDEPRPWVSKPAPAVFLDACRQVMGRVPYSLKGWTLDGQTCSLQARAVTATYTRQGNSTVLELQQQARAELGVLPDVMTEGDKAGLKFPLPALPDADESLMGRTEVMPIFRSHFQKLAVKLDPLAPVPSQTEAEAKQYKPRAWVGWTYKITATRLTPHDTNTSSSQLFSGLILPGMRITSITGVISGQSPFITYDIEGAFYAN
jgi:hypothetical protein